MTQPRLLAIDDEPGILNILGDLGQHAGYETYATSEPDEFLQRAHDWGPDLILMDLQMPQIDGVELLRRLAGDDVRSPIVLMSGVDDKLLRTVGDLGTDLGLNMAGVLHKPIRAETFLRTMVSRSAPAGSTEGQDARQELHDAIQREELTLFYQPIVDLASRDLVAAEALVRWNHPREGILTPDRFVPLAEQKGLIDELTWLVLRLAIAQAGHWAKNGFPLAVSINLSATNLHDATLPDRIGDLCREHGVPPDRIWLELTETATSDNPTVLKTILSRMRLKAFRLAIDDFGTGYSSMKQLRLLPFSELKIDLSFVQDMLQSRDASIIVDAILALAGAFDIAVVAEGIETEAQLAALVQRGCTIGQGYLFSKPVPPDELMQRFRHTTIRH